MTAFVAKRADVGNGGLARKTALEALQNMRWESWQSPVAMPMWAIMRYTLDGPEAYYVCHNFRVTFFERIHEVNPYAGCARGYNR